MSAATPGVTGNEADYMREAWELCQICERQNDPCRGGSAIFPHQIFRNPCLGRLENLVNVEIYNHFLTLLAVDLGGTFSRSEIRRIIWANFQPDFYQHKVNQAIVDLIAKVANRIVGKLRANPNLEAEEKLQGIEIQLIQSFISQQYGNMVPTEIIISILSREETADPIIDARVRDTSEMLKSCFEAAKKYLKVSDPEAWKRVKTEFELILENGKKK
jgi:hypothetical protein